METLVASCVRVQALLALLWFWFVSAGGFSRNFQLAVKAKHSQRKWVPKSFLDSPLSKKGSGDSLLWCGSFQRQSPTPRSSAGDSPARLEVRTQYFFGRSQLRTWAPTSRNKHLYWSVSKAHSYDIKSAPSSSSAWQSAAFTTPQWKVERDGGTGSVVWAASCRAARRGGSGTGESRGAQCHC